MFYVVCDIKYCVVNLNARYSRSMMEGIAVNNTTIFVIYNIVVLLTAIPSTIDLL
jgi:hypothetical protein